MHNNINNLLPKLFVLLIVLAPLSKYPSWALPMFQFTSFRIGLYQLLALVFVVLTAIQLYKTGRPLSIKNKYTFGALTLLAVLAVLNLLGSVQVGRGVIMTASFLFLLLVVVCGRWFMQANPTVLTKVEPYVLKAGFVYAAVSLLQLVIGTYTMKYSLLCTGCSGGVFGFPRINVFAAEPLFWANSLLPFFAFALVAYVVKRTRLSLYALSALSVTMALTFARGAFLAMGAMLGMLGVVVIIRSRSWLKGYMRSLGVVTLSMIVGFLLLVVSAVAKHTTAPYIAYNTARGMIEHLSMGKIDLAEKKETPVLAATPVTPAVVASTPETPAVIKDTFVSRGFVEASSNDRLTAASLARQAWTYNARTVMFGVGLGNLGPFVVQNIRTDVPRNLTVYIFYVLFVTEMGIVGLGCLLFLYATALKNLHRNLSHYSVVAAIVLVGFLVQYVFFGSYINVVYIWLWLGVGLGMGTNRKIRNEK